MCSVTALEVSEILASKSHNSKSVLVFLSNRREEWVYLFINDFSLLICVCMICIVLTEWYT